MDHRGNRLTIDFTGLAVFVTNAPQGKLRVLLAQATAESGAHAEGGATAMGEAMTKGMPVAPEADADRGKGKKVDQAAMDQAAMVHAAPMRHLPIVSFDAKYLHQFVGKSKVPVIQLPNGDQIASWSVENRILTMQKWTDAYPDEVVRCQEGGDLPWYPRDPMAEMDVRWVPSLKVVTGSDQIRSDYLSNDPSQGGKDPAIAARFDLDSGYLFSHAEVNRRQPMDLWDFEVGNGKPQTHTQYLGDTLRLELHSATTDLVVLEARAFGDFGDVERLELQPQGGRLEIAVTNFPEELQPGVPLGHFHYYYDLLDKPQRRPDPQPSGKTPADYPVPPANKGVARGLAYSIQQVKCTPGMVP